MRDQISLLRELQFLWANLQFKFKLAFMVGVVLSLVSSFAEIISIGSIAPFITGLTYPDKILIFFPWLSNIQLLVGTKTLEQTAILLFMTAIVIAMLFRIFLMIFNAKLAYKLGIFISKTVLENILYKPYSYHVNQNSSQILTLVSQKINAVVGNIFYPLLTFCNSIIMLCVVMISLGTLYPIPTIIVGASVILIYATTAFLSRKALLINSKLIAEHSTGLLKAVNESLGGIRDVIIDGTQKMFLNIFYHANSQLKNAEARNIYFSQGPKFLIEMIGMLAISLIAYKFTSSGNNFSLIIPALGVVALGAQRMLPILQQAYASWVSIQGSVIQLHEVLEVAYPVSTYVSSSKNFALKAIEFSHKIQLENVSFRFQKTDPWILNEVNLEIQKGERIGLIGTTGSGKSTLADVLMGLLPVNQGNLFIDNQLITITESASWRLNVAHVPQSIFLADSTIIENIAFGIEPSTINMSRAIEAARQAQLLEFINSLPNGFHTYIGERGIRLSGGQRQRIGIARALYKQAQLIIFDEATSALDDKTEYLIMDTIYQLNDQLTIILIAHRLTTLKGCNKIVEIEHGKVARIGSYEEIISPKLKNLLTKK
jgi:ATP-binding cassette subfamily B protein